MITEVNGFKVPRAMSYSEQVRRLEAAFPEPCVGTVAYKSEVERLEAEAEAARLDFVNTEMGSKKKDVAREAMRGARANLAAHVEGGEPVMQFVDEKTEPTFNFEDDFGDMATLAATATESQVGGDHYTKQGIQPLEATFANFSYEGIQAAIYTKVNKYLTRDKGTHRQDITKAIHVLQMQLEYYDRFNAVDTLAPRHTNQPIEGNK